MRPTPHPSHGSEIITSWIANKPNCNLRATKDQATLQGWDQLHWGWNQIPDKYQTCIKQISNKHQRYIKEVLNKYKDTSATNMPVYYTTRSQ